MNPRTVFATSWVALLVLSGMGMVAPAATDDDHPVEACSQPYHVSGAGWDFCWQQDDVRAQGIEINRAFFGGESVVWKMGVPFTLTKYETTQFGPFKDTLGAPAGGVPGYGRGAMELEPSECPRFFGGQAQLLNNGRLCVESRGGPQPAVAVWGRYDVYNYQFLQGWTFDARGHITPMLGMGGHLYDGSNVGAHGHNHNHHIYWRIDFDVAGAGDDVFQQFQRVTGGVQGSGQIVALGSCESKGAVAATGWCEVPVESQLQRNVQLQNKWRVKDALETNSQGRHKSYEFALHSDQVADAFSTFDAMAVQYQGDTRELGYEVPTTPTTGDSALNNYMLPPGVVDDPVVWAAMHVYHDTRDEDRGSMSAHWVDFDIRPNNFNNQNPGENTFK